LIFQIDIYEVYALCLLKPNTECMIMILPGPYIWLLLCSLQAALAMVNVWWYALKFPLCNEGMAMSFFAPSMFRAVLCLETQSRQSALINHCALSMTLVRLHYRTGYMYLAGSCLCCISGLPGHTSLPTYKEHTMASDRAYYSDQLKKYSIGVDDQTKCSVFGLAVNAIWQWYDAFPGSWQLHNIWSGSNMELMLYSGLSFVKNIVSRTQINAQCFIQCALLSFPWHISL